VGPLRRRQGEGGQGVLGRVMAGAAVGEYFTGVHGSLLADGGYILTIVHFCGFVHSGFAAKAGARQKRTGMVEFAPRMWYAGRQNKAAAAGAQGAAEEGLP